MQSVNDERPEVAQVGDFSYFDTYAQCGRKGYYRYTLGLEAHDEATPLVAGSAIHAGLHHLYTHEWDVEGAVEALHAEWGGRSPARASKWAFLTPGHTEIVLRNYADRHSLDEWDAVFSPQGTRLAEQALVMDWDGIGYGGKPDLAVAKHGQLFALDFKCTSAWVNEWWASKFRISHQMRGYMKLLSEALSKELNGVFIQGIYMGEKANDPPEKWKTRKSSPDVLFGPYLFSPALVEETRTWALSWQRTIRAWQERAAAGEGEAAFPQTTGQLCNSCEFFDLCKAQPFARVGLAHTLYRRRNMDGKTLLSGAA